MTPDRVFAVLLRLYPARTRRGFGRGMAAAWSADLAAARARGRGAVLLFWTIAIADTARFAFAARLPGPGALAVDWRDAWRSLRSNPMVSLFCIASLALGIGGVTALFAMLNSLAMKPLPVREPQRLALLDDGSWTNPIWEAIRDRQSAVAESACAWATDAFNLAPAGRADNVRGLFVSGGFFDVLGVRAAAGRLLDARDDVRGGAAAPVAVISHAFWQSRFDASPDAIGSTLVIERVPFTIVGVTAARFFGPDVGRAYDVAIPLATEPLVRAGSRALDDRLSWWVNVMARLRPGQSAEDATARLRGIQPQIRALTLPSIGGDDDRKQYLSEPMTFVPSPGGRSPLRRRYEQPLTAILAVIAVVLLIACANIASLLIARAAARRREIAIRLALGASRMRVARQLLAESALIALAGAAGGTLVAWWGGRLLLAQLSTYAGRIDLDLTPDWRLLAFASIVTGAAALAAGLAPALSVGGLAAGDALKDRPGGTSEAPTLARHASVVLQVALSLVLLVAAGLFTRTFARLSTRDIGFDRDGVWLVTADTSRSQAKGDARLQLFERLIAGAASVPGVSSAAGSFISPVGSAAWNTVIELRGSTLPRRQRTSWVNAVTPQWFETMGVHLIQGRDFAAIDRRGAPRVAIVNRAFERRFLGGSGAVGQTFAAQEPEGAVRYEVVGLVEDSVYRSLRSPMDPTMYVPVAQAANLDWMLVVTARTGTRLVGAAAAITNAMQRVDADAVLSVRTLREQLDASLTQERLLAMLAAFFGGLALLLSALGLYGLTAFAVASRRGEIGIRIALGASADGIVRLVLRRVAVLVTVGLGLGAGLSAWAAPLVGALLYGIEPRDPLTFVAAAIVLLGVAMVAAWLPARLAARLDPTVALRET